MTAVDLRPTHRTPATMTDYQRMMAAAFAEQTVACPKCDAQVGAWCKSKGGYQNSAVGFHTARKALIAHFDEDERIAASASMFAEQDRRRAAVAEEMCRKEQDPVYVAQRDATRAYISGLFDQAAENQRAEERDLRARCTDRPFRYSRTHADACRCKVTGEIEYTKEFAEARRLRDLTGTLPVTDLAAVRASRRRPTGLDVA